MEELTVNDTARRTGRLFILFAVSLALPLLAPRAAYAQRYWFEDYEKVVQLVDMQKMDEASTLLAGLIEHHPEPVSGIRIYGDTYLDYFPYAQRARIQIHKGDAQGAAESLAICEAFGAMKKSPRGEKLLSELRRQVSQMEPNRTVTNATGQQK